jgi:superfamily I DNA/RNA helicase
MNVGQILETHLGWAAKALGIQVASPVFDGASEKEIKDLLAYLRLVINPFDHTSFFAFSTPHHADSAKKFEEQLYTLISQQSPSVSFFDACVQMSETLPPQKKNSVAQFLSVFKDISCTSKPSDALEQIITHTHYHTYLKKRMNRMKPKQEHKTLKSL